MMRPERRLVYRFWTLSFLDRDDIIREFNRLAELWDAVEKLSQDKEDIPNPFRRGV